ncbi:MAG: 2-oxo acid dehydrogenase subunit E2 [Chloroflexi bacterium]|nr:2-oxo acid dehydrogenase subunit E2 [Chloroflexota bacterium]
MMNVFMPRLGLSMQEGTIVKWLVSEGTLVKKGEGIAEISSEKLTYTVEADADGVITQLLYPEDDVVTSGEVIALLDENALSTPGETPQAAAAAGMAEQDPWRQVHSRTALPSTRKVIAERMAGSLARSPQATVTTRVDVSRLVELRAQFAAMGAKISYTDLFTKIVAQALQENLSLNASLQDGEWVIYRSINIGVAVAAEDALYVPVVRDVQTKTLRQVSAEISQLSRKVKEGCLEAEDMLGGTFTLSNMGMLDVDVMTPIINPPEAAILAIGSVRKEAVVDAEDHIVIRPVAILSLTIDHAILDGYPAARFLESIKKIVQSADLTLD